MFFICRRIAYCGRIVYCTLLFNVLEAVQARDDNMPVPHTTRSSFLRSRRRINQQVHGPLQSVQHHAAHRNLWHVEREGEGEEESRKRKKVISCLNTYQSTSTTPHARPWLTTALKSFLLHGQNPRQGGGGGCEVCVCAKCVCVCVCVCACEVCVCVCVCV